jgi:hypothetical protein
VAGLDQLAEFRDVFETVLIPQLATRIGLWALGPTFAGSRLISADADLVAAGLLLDLKTGQGDKRDDGTRRSGLDRKELYQLIGYALLDFDDAYHISEVGIFNARFGYLATWPLGHLLAELAGSAVDLPAARKDFAQMLNQSPSVV